MDELIYYEAMHNPVLSDEQSITVGFLGALFPLSGVKEPLAYLNTIPINLSSLREHSKLA